MTKKALVLIDIQEDYTGATAKPPFPYENSDKFIANVNSLISACSSRNMPVIYVRQEFSGLIGTLISKIFAHNTAQKGDPGAEFDKRLTIASGLLFSKPQGSAFSNKSFAEYLKINQITHLYIAGLDAEYCVWSTAHRASRKNIAVNILTDTILLKNKHKQAHILNKYQKAGFNLISSADIFKD